MVLASASSGSGSPARRSAYASTASRASRSLAAGTSTESKGLGRRARVESPRRLTSSHHFSAAIGMAPSAAPGSLLRSRTLVVTSGLTAGEAARTHARVLLTGARQIPHPGAWAYETRAACRARYERGWIGPAARDECAPAAD